MKNAKRIVSKNIRFAVVMLCLAVAVGFVISNLYVLRLAGGIADEVHREMQSTLVKAEVDELIDLAVRDQSQISVWDDSVIALDGEIDREFVRSEIVDWLWADFGIQTTLVINPENQPIVSIHEDQLRDASYGQPVAEQAFGLITAARQTFAAQRDDLTSLSTLHIAGIREINGNYGVLVAQAIVPHEDYSLTPKEPNVLVTYTPMLPEFLKDIELEIGITGLVLGRTTDPRSEVLNTIVGGNGSENQAIATWQTSSPSQSIWLQSTAPLVGLFSIVLFGLFLIARRYGRVFHELQASEEQNRFLALHDALTGLPNRLQFDRALEETIEQGNQDRCAILCVDLDRFKSVNDNFGHQAGDAVIKTVAKRIANAVSSDGLTARIGGDEFIILLHTDLDQQNVLKRCELIIESICAEVTFDGGSAHVGASIGVAWWPDDALTAKSIIRSADEALYRAKELGRGRPVLATSNDRNNSAQVA